MQLPYRFMVIDDDKTSNLLCSFVLQRFCPGVAIAIYNSCSEALASITAEAVLTDQTTTIFLDINMGEMSGWDFLDIFKGLSPEVHLRYNIFMLSSSLDSRDKQRADQNPFVRGMIAKPLTTQILLQLFQCSGTQALQ